MKIEKIAIGNDHNGFYFKKEIKKELENNGYIVKDFGQYKETPPSKDHRIAEMLALSVSCGESDRGILICGSGIGMSIVANKIPGCIAALCYNSFSAENARKRNNSNILVLGSKIISLESAKEIVKLWLNTDFERGAKDKRNIERFNDLMNIDSKYRKKL